MAGLFSGNLFGMGQGADFSDIASLARESVPSTSGGKGGSASAYLPGGSGGGDKSGGGAAYIPTDTSAYAPMPYAPAADNTVYIVGGVAVVGLIAAYFLMNRGRRAVTSNRGHRGRRSRRRGR